MYIYIKVDVCIYMYIYIYKMIAAAQPVWRVSATSNARKGVATCFRWRARERATGEKKKGEGGTAAPAAFRGP